MEKTLVVVESPAKAKTIKKYLGPGYEVKASVGHIKDLPTSVPRGDAGAKGPGSARPKKNPTDGVLGVDVQHGFVPHYETIPGKEKIIKELRKAAQDARRVFLATDPDREGEAIAWHVSEELGKPAESIYRVLFNELTEKTIKQAIKSPGRLDPDKYNAQQARRILDRIVGYQLSPLLWQKVQYGLSAGRVQSVALKLIVDRQREVDTFVPQEYWSLGALLEADAPPSFEAKLIEEHGNRVEIPDGETAASLAARAGKGPFQVADVKRRERSRKPSPPFITSTLQQEASKRLRLTSNRTMRIAQQLYEGVELGPRGSVGLITYMRTDSPRIAPEALQAVREHIKATYGARYLPEKAHVYKGRKTAQEAHEAIRPTSLDLTPDAVAQFLDKSQAAVYRLIWNRFVASQMSPAIFDQTTVNIQCGSLLFRVSGSVLKFDGFLRVYQQEETLEERDSQDEEADRALPPLKPGQKLALLKMAPRQHFTQAPPLFTEASLIKELEEKGIGRPSTYAEIVTTIQKRNYVDLADKKFRPTLLGKLIASLLADSFPNLLSAQFTADMESSLDLIEEGSASLTATLEDFYSPFQSDLRSAKQNMTNVKREGILTGLECPQCGHGVLLRSGRYGLFLGCSAYPDCDYTRNISAQKAQASEPVPTDEKCPNCGAHMVMRDGRTGPFLSCSRYPECKTTRPLSTGVNCPECKTGEMVQRRSRRGKTFFSCSRYPSCTYSLWNKPVSEKCPNPDCDSPIMEEKRSAKEGTYLQCPKCKRKAT
ncbi:MAG: type I DNA topoisomerase [Thermodesulfobacteriota bacterium]